MRTALLLALCLVGCATTSPGTPAPGIPSEPNGTLCTSKSDCDGRYCVKPADNAQGACSQNETGAKCVTAEDCASGEYCHRPVGFDGVCFKQ